jgi:small subunit ribosomal protein S16
MLVIRMQRTGRKGHAQFRIVVQDSRRTPTSGKIVALLGSYNPHAKTVSIDKEKAALYLNNGAQPSERIARLFKSEGIALPKWVVLSADKERAVKNPDKRRSTAPAQPVEEVETPAEAEETTPVEAAVEEVAAEVPESEAPATEAAPVEAEAAVEETPAA